MNANGKKSVAAQHNVSRAYPQGINWDINIPHVDLMRIIDESIIKFSDRPAIDFLGKKLTYQELGQEISHAAKGLQEMGVKPGDKVGLYMPNTPYYPIMFMAALKMGATVVNYSPLYTKEELRRQIKDSGTSVMVSLDLKDFHDKAKDLVDEGTLDKMIRCPMSNMLPTFKGLAFNILKHKEIASDPTHSWFSLRNKFNDEALDKRKYVTYRELTDNDAMYESVTVDPEDIAVLQYTGGTTGVPKGAMLSHFNLVSNAYQIEEFFGYSKGKEDDPAYIRAGQERVIATIPYFHVFGMMVSMISSMKMGSELVILPNPRDIKMTMNALQKHEPKIFPAVPRLLQAISEDESVFDFNLRGLGNVISGGAALPDDVAKNFEAAVGKDNIIIQGYGLSETSPVAASNPATGVRKNDTVGLPYPRTEIKITDPDDPDKILDMGEVGEICIRGPQVMKGYYNRPDETAEVMTEDGWFRTGDLGYLDDDMYLKIVDRKKRMIIVNGHNAYPNQIEQVITSHPAVAECVVIGLPDERSGESAKAFVRFLENADKPDEAELRAFLSERLNKLDIPKEFEFRTEELPKTSVGKPDYKVLEREEYEKRGLLPKDTQKPKAGGSNAKLTP